MLYSLKMGKKWSDCGQPSELQGLGQVKAANRGIIHVQTEARILALIWR